MDDRQADLAVADVHEGNRRLESAGGLLPVAAVGDVHVALDHVVGGLGEGGVRTGQVGGEDRPQQVVAGAVVHRHLHVHPPAAGRERVDAGDDAVDELIGTPVAVRPDRHRQGDAGADRRRQRAVLDDLDFGGRAQRQDGPLPLAVGAGPRVADFRDVLEMVQVAEDLGGRLVQQVDGAVGVGGDGQDVVLDGGRPCDHRAGAVLVVVPRLDAVQAIAHRRQAVGPQADGVTLDRQPQGQLAGALEGGLVVHGGDFLDGRLLAGRVDHAVAGHVPFGGEVHRRPHHLVAAAWGGVEYGQEDVAVGTAGGVDPPDDLLDGSSPDAAGDDLDLLVADGGFVVDPVHRPAVERVVGLVGQQHLPRAGEVEGGVFASQVGGDGGPGLGPSDQGQLARPVRLADVGAVAHHRGEQVRPDALAERVSHLAGQHVQFDAVAVDVLADGADVVGQGRVANGAFAEDAVGLVDDADLGLVGLDAVVALHRQAAGGPRAEDLLPVKLDEGVGEVLGVEIARRLEDVVAGGGLPVAQADRQPAVFPVVGHSRVVAVEHDGAVDEVEEVRPGIVAQAEAQHARPVG